MEDNRKIREMYDCVTIVSDEELYPLQKWYNQLIDKSIDEITVEDILKMMRQKQFIDLALSRAINYLKENVFAGELYDGEILEKISEIDNSFLKFYVYDLKDITEHAFKKSVTHKWSYCGEKEEFIEIANKISRKLANIERKQMGQRANK